MTRSRLIPIRSGLAVLVTGTLLPLFTYAAANPSVNPTAPPPGGQGSSIITSTATPQKKLGSLIIGDPGINPKNRLCLNAQAGASASSDPNCLASWGDLGGALGGPFVQLRQDNFNSSNAAAYPKQSGYVRIRGTQPAAPSFTVRSDINDAFLSSQTALYADGVLQDNYAGYFTGHVSINPTITSSLGRLCLNGTSNVLDASGHGCITSWSQVPGAVSNYLQRQTVNPPVTQTGSVGLQKAYQSGAVVLGTPPSTAPAGLTKPYCGDGLCSQEINEQVSSNANYCPLDCVSPALPQQLTASSQQGFVSLSFRSRVDPSVGPSDSVYALIIRSASSSPTFVPTDGQLYSATGDANFAIIFAGFVTQNSLTTINDSGYGMVQGRTYTYRYYQGNSFPIFNKSTVNYLQATGINFSSSGGSCDPNCGGGDEHPIIPVHGHG